MVEKMRKQRDELRRQDDHDTYIQTMSGNGLEDVYDLALYYDPLDFKSQKALALMNFYKVSFKRVNSSSPVLQHPLLEANAEVPEEGRTSER